MIFFANTAVCLIQHQDKNYGVQRMGRHCDYGGIRAPVLAHLTPGCRSLSPSRLCHSPEERLTHGRNGPILRTDYGHAEAGGFDYSDVPGPLMASTKFSSKRRILVMIGRPGVASSSDDKPKKWSLFIESSEQEWPCNKFAALGFGGPESDSRYWALIASHKFCSRIW